MTEVCPPAAPQPAWRAWCAVVILVFLLLVAVGAIGDGFRTATAGTASELFAFATSPVIALMVGLIATSLTQSSSTVSSIIVGLVAGGLPLAIAIPMIMGANIGTSLTSTLVSLGHVRKGPEFYRAYSAATVHDSFNVMAVCLLLPLEILLHPLERLAHGFAALFEPGGEGLAMQAKGLSVIIRPVLDVMNIGLSWLPIRWSGLVLIVAGVLLILYVVAALGAVLRRVLVGRVQQALHRALGHGPLTAMLWGGAITVAVQSSSTTTALIVPLAGTGAVSLREVYPFTLGANVGTTVTALLASMAVTGPLALLALEIALVHLFFNLLGIALIYGLPPLRGLPMAMAGALAASAQLSPWYIVAYVAGLFFALPALLVAVSSLL